MKKITIIVLMAIACSNSFAQVSKREADVKELLELTGTAKISIQVMNNMIASYKAQFPNVTNEFWDEFMKEVNMSELVDLVAPVYLKYYTAEEIEGLIKFYKSPLGRKVTATMPFITQDSFYIGQEWGKRISEKVNSKLVQKGYIKNG